MWFTPAIAAPPTPTRPTELVVEVTGALAEITATRTFHHPGPDPIDAELWFAVPPAAAVDRVVVTIGDRVITSRVEAIEDARRVYLAAANAGRTATLLELADDDLVVQHLANLQPGDDVTVELHLVQTAARRDGTWELVLPLTVAPRLQDPADPGPTYVVTGPDADPRSAPEVERVNARFAVHAGHWVNWIDAPSHPHRSTLDGADATLVVDQAPANRDLVVRWSTATQDPSTAVWVAGTHAVLLLEAPAPWARYSRPPRDVVLLVDASDTMVGRWPAVVEVVRAVLTGVRPDDHLTVLVFADSVRGLALRELGTVDAVRRVTDRLHTLPLGGATNLPLAMSFAEALPIPDGGPRTVVVVSDGGGERVSPPGPGVTVHTIGVGAATHRALLDRLARDGGGLSVTVTPEDDPGQVVQPIVDALPGPVLDGVTLSWASTAPRTVPPLYPGQVVTVAAEGVTCGRVVVEGSYLGHPFTTFATPRCEEHSRAVEVTWARLAVEARADRPDEARAVALEFGIASPYTSFVGVDDVVRGSPATGSDTVALAPPVDVASRHAIVLSEETLQRVPGGTRPAAGNAWFDLLPTRPSALAAAAGWTGTRPTVTGFGLERSELPPSVEAWVGRGGVAAHHGAGDPLVYAGLARPPDDIWASATLGAPAAGTSGGFGGAALGGPITSNTAAWGEVTGRTDTVDGVTRDRIVGALALGHRTDTALGAIVDRDTLEFDGRTAPIGGAAGWLDAWADVGSGSAGLGLAFDREELDAAHRTRAGARAELQASGDALGFDLDAALTRVAWVDDAGWITSGAGSARWTPGPFSFDAEVRVDAPGGVSPRARAGWSPLGPTDDRTRIALGFERTVDLARVVPDGVSDVAAPTAETAYAEVAAGAGGYTGGLVGAAARQSLPFVASPVAPPVSAPTLRRDVGWVEAWTRIDRPGWTVTGSARRWFAPAADGLTATPDAAWVAGALDPYRRWAAAGSVFWELPTDPWALSLGVLGSAAGAVSNGSADPWWLGPTSVVGAAARQRVPVPRGALTVQGAVTRAANDPGGSAMPWEWWYLTGDAPPPPSWQLELSVTASFGG